MSCDEVFVEYLLELLSPIGEVTTKRMFGGVGFFNDALMFALVADSTLYIKVDDENRTDFESLDLEPFIYEKTNKNVTISYYQAPEEALDDSDMMHRWALSGLRAAKRAQKKTSSKKEEPANNKFEKAVEPSGRRATRGLEQDIEELVADAESDDISFDGELA